jgi:oligopeptide/dipeptide ABC transporter ATP-binding protein
MSLLEFDELNVWFELPDGSSVHAVRDLSLSLQRGDRLGLVGESGSGKTTAILAAMGLLPATATVSGEIRLDGVPLLATTEKQRRAHRWKDISMVFQGAMNALNPVRRIGQQLVEPMRLHGTANREEGMRRAGELLTLVGLEPSHLRRYPHELSGGMRQRVCIAMALACDPSVLLADEPTTALDVIVQAEILALLRRLVNELGLTLILVTHDLPVVAQVCDRVAVMYGGGLMEQGSVEEITRQPAHPYTRLLFQATPDLEDDTPVAALPRVLDLDISGTGCPFRLRCDSAFERCATETPEPRVLGDGHTSACHLHDQQLDGALRALPGRVVT